MKRMRNFIDNVQPVLKMGRSKFDLSYSHKTTMDVGDLCPVYLQEIYPGDSIKEKSTFVIRTTNPYLRPVMDNLYLDMYYFFIPNRLVWSRWQEFMGENVSGFWKQNNTPVVPRVRLPLQDPNGGPAINPKSVAAYFGINIGIGEPPGSPNVAALIQEIPFRANALVYNEWFRNENFEAPVYINFGDNSQAPVLNNNNWSVNNFHGLVPKVNKLADYFTSCLPEPQKGDAVDIPISDAPVIAKSGVNNTSLFTYVSGAKDNVLHFDYYDSNSNTWSDNLSTINLGVNNVGALRGEYLSADPFNYYLTPDNLVALNTESIGNINDLRFAFQLQKLLEKDARGGTRYVEYLAEHFGVISPDARLQRPEFLGGKRVPLQIQEVAQTSESTQSSPLAQLSAYSATINQSGFSKGFVEHGFIIGYAVIRQKHTYQQGIERFWMREDRYDFYDPVFANIGEQPVYRSEIYADGLLERDKGIIFGYNEAWADLRYRPGRITGFLNSTSNSGFDIWHFGDLYANAPVLGNQFMKETTDYVDRALSVPSATAPNFVVDFYHNVQAARVLSLYSIPGLVDHH